jgi:uncharacterized membrane protein
MKGQMYILEATISILLILFIVVYLFQNPLNSPEYERMNYKIKTYKAITVLDDTGKLRKDVVNNNVSSIRDNLYPFMPKNLNYNVTIFNDTSNITMKPSSSSDMISVSYFLAGDFDNYLPRDVRVYLWGFE